MGASVRSQYIGSGALAECTAHIDDLAQQQRRVERSTFRQWVKQQKALDEAVAELATQLRALVYLVFWDNGYHRHKRQWRRRRMTKESVPMIEASTHDLTFDEFNELIRLIDSNEATSEQRALLRNYLQQWPPFAQKLADATDALMARLAKSLYGSETGAGALAVDVYSAKLKAELGYDDAPEVERLLIQHLIVCWMRMQEVEWHYQNRMDGHYSASERDYWERRLSATQRRYLRTVETLARIRKLNLRLQVNIAQQQIVTGS